MWCGKSTTPALFACLRCFITLINIILAIYAVFLFLFSLLFLLWMDYYLFFNSDQVQFIIITFLLSISGSIFCFSCFACCCLIRAKSPNVLSYLYSISIGSILIVELVSIITTFYYRDFLTNALRNGIFLSMEKYGMNNDINQAIDILQAQVGCCGVLKPSDWQNTNWGKGHKERFPHSCCQTTTTGICNQKELGSVLYEEGCSTKIVSILEGYAFHFISFLLVTILLHSLAMCMVCCMIKVKGQYTAIT